MYCEKCGKKLIDGEIFCGQCGERIDQKQGEKKGKGALVISIIAIVLAAGVLVAIIVLFCLGRTKKEDSTPMQQTATATGPATDATDSSVGTPEPEPTKEPFQPAVVTDKVKKELEPLMKETTYYFALIGEAEQVDDSDLYRTIMVYYNLQYRDDVIGYSEKESVAKPKVEKELFNLFGEDSKYELKYQETYPGYLYIKKDGDIQYNGGDWGDGIPWGKTISIVETAPEQYRVVRHTGVKSSDTGEVFYNRKITCDVIKNPSGKYGYNITHFREYQRGDTKAE